MSRGAFHIGTSGWTYQHWKRRCYPVGLPSSEWLSYYADHFDAVEINYSFYHLPSRKTVARWKEQAPEGFLYAIKASRLLTHIKRLKGCARELETFLRRVKPFGEHLGPILYQLPPGFHVDTARLAQFIERLPLDFCHVMEFRHSSWFVEEVRSMLDNAGVTFCIHDSQGMTCPEWVTSQSVYLRFHGSTKTRQGRYSPGELQLVACNVADHLKAGRTVYAFFNNDWNGYAIRNAQNLRELVNRPKSIKRKATRRN